MRSASQALLPFVALVVGFVAGAGFGVVVLSDDPGAAPPEAAYDSARSRGAAEADPGAAPEATRDAPRRRGVSTDDVLVENALRSAAGLPPTQGDGVVTGSVRDALAKPLPGVTITATTDPWSLDEPVEGAPDVGPDASLEDRVRRLVWEHRFREASRRTAVTGEDGTFRLEGLVAARYGLQVQLAGWQFECREDWAASPGESREFTARPVVGVAIQVVMPDGSVPDTADVWYEVSGSGSTSHHAWAPEQHQLELAAGLYTFSASAGEQSAYSVHNVPVEVTAEGGVAVDLRLVARPGVVGRVEFAGEARPMMLGITALPLGDGGDAGPERLITAPHSTWFSEPFEFALLDLPPGSYLVGAVLRTGTVLDSAVLEIADRPVEHVFAVGNVDVRDYVTVRLRGPDGAPVTGGVEFSAGYDSDGGSSFDGSFSAEPEADGSYHVPITVPGGPEEGFDGWSRSGGPFDGGLTAGLRYHLTATSERFGQKRVQYDPLVDRELDLTFSEPAFAIVTVAGYESSPWRGRVEATLLPAGAAGAFQGNWLNDDQRRMTPQGVARVGPVEPGTYAVSLMVLTEQNGYRSVLQQEVTLGVGETPVTMVLPDLYDLIVVVDGAQLDLDLHRDPAPHQTTDFLDEGVMNGQQTTFAALASGRYRVRHYGDGSTGEMLVDVPTGGPVTFRPTPYNALRIESPPEGSDGVLQRGDVVTSIGIGGQGMDGERRIRAALALAGTHETVALTVHRGGSVREIEVPSVWLEAWGFVYWVR